MASLLFLHKRKIVKIDKKLLQLQYSWKSYKNQNLFYMVDLAVDKIL